MATLQKAQRKRAKARIGISGPSGSGKTYSALRLAYGLVGDWEKIAIVDTEVGSSHNYSHLGEFNVLEITDPFSPEKFIDSIKTCEKAGMEVIIIDSVSHEWEGRGGCLELVETIAKAKFKGNNWAAWSEVTPRHQKFIESITQSSAHIITTSRSKTDTTIIDGKPKKVGTKDIQREGFEYELTLMFNVDRETHLANTSKDRTSLFIDRDPFLLTEKTGQEFKDWLDTGVDPRKAAEEQKKAEEEKKEALYNEYLEKLSQTKNNEELKNIWEAIKKDSLFLGESFAQDLRERVVAIKQEKESTPKEEPKPKPKKAPEIAKPKPKPKSEPLPEPEPEPTQEQEQQQEQEIDEVHSMKLRSNFIARVKETKNEEELAKVLEAVEKVSSNNLLTERDYGVIYSNVGIRRKTNFL